MIDREKLIESAANEIRQGLAMTAPIWETITRRAAVSVTPVIVAAVTDEVRTLHTPRMRKGSRICAYCGTYWPCTTAEMLDEIDAAAGVTR